MVQLCDGNVRKGVTGTSWWTLTPCLPIGLSGLPPFALLVDNVENFTLRKGQFAWIINRCGILDETFEVCDTEGIGDRHTCIHGLGFVLVGVWLRRDIASRNDYAISCCAACTPHNQR